MSPNSGTIVDFSGKDLTENDVKERIQELRKLILEDNTLKKFRTDDEYLLRFLYSTKFDVLAAFQRMSSFCDLMMEHPNWFARNGPLDKKKQFERGDKVLFRERDRAGRGIILQRVGKLDVNSCPAEEAQLLEMLLEIIMDDPQIQAAGLSAIVDMQGYSWRLFKWFTPSNLKIAVKKMEFYPINEILIHIVNTSFLLNATVKLVWPFFSERIKNMFKFHFNDWSSLHEYINPDILPSEYGGTGPDIDFEKASQYVFDNNDKVEEKLKHRIGLQN